METEETGNPAAKGILMSKILLEERLAMLRRLNAQSGKPGDRNFIRLMAETVQAKLPDNYGFVVMACSFENKPGDPLIYASNIARETAIPLVKEFPFRAGAGEDWMNHIK